MSSTRAPNNDILPVMCVNVVPVFVTNLGSTQHLGVVKSLFTPIVVVTYTSSTGTVGFQDHLRVSNWIYILVVEPGTNGSYSECAVRLDVGVVGTVSVSMSMVVKTSMFTRGSWVQVQIVGLMVPVYRVFTVQ